MALYDDLYRIARRTLLNQVSVTDRLIRQLYIRAAKSIAKQIETAKAGSLTERWLTAYKSALDAEIQRLGNGIYSAIERGAQRAAEARVECTAEYLRRACAAAEVDDAFTPTLANVPTDTLRAMIEGKLYTDGRMLSTRIWNEMGRLEGNIAEVIQQGVAQQMDAITLARQLEAYVNPDAAQPVSWHTLYPDIPFDREIDYNALRLARTSLNHAHWAAGKAAAKKNPLCKGMKWNLSNSHHERQVEPNGEDVCDAYARHDEGLGAGVYPIDALPMPHPQCLCYQTEAVPTLEDVADLLRAWARGETESPEMDEGFRKWQQENAEELNNWYSDEDLIRQELDKKLDTSIIDTASVARAMHANPIIEDGKIYRYMLNPEQKHYSHFVQAGYSSAADGERLRTEILRQSENAVAQGIRHCAYDPRHVQFSTFVWLGEGEKRRRFLVGWQVDQGAEFARLTSCYRVDK